MAEVLLVHLLVLTVAERHLVMEGRRDTEVANQVEQEAVDWRI